MKLLCLYLVQHLLHQIKAQKFYTDLDLYQQCKVLQKKEEFRDFSRPLSDFPVLFKADLIFKDFQESPLNSSTFQACANPGKHDQQNKMLVWLVRDMCALIMSFIQSSVLASKT